MNCKMRMWENITPAILSRFGPHLETHFSRNISTLGSCHHGRGTTEHHTNRVHGATRVSAVPIFTYTGGMAVGANPTTLGISGNVGNLELVQPQLPLLLPYWDRVTKINR